jgi:hypothetical protein
VSELTGASQRCGDRAFLSGLDRRQPIVARRAVECAPVVALKITGLPVSRSAIEGVNPQTGEWARAMSGVSQTEARCSRGSEEVRHCWDAIGDGQVLTRERCAARCRAVAVCVSLWMRRLDFCFIAGANGSVPLYSKDAVCMETGGLWVDVILRRAGTPGSVTYDRR